MPCQRVGFNREPVWTGTGMNRNHYEPEPAGLQPEQEPAELEPAPTQTEPNQTVGFLNTGDKPANNWETGQ